MGHYILVEGEPVHEPDLMRWAEWNFDGGIDRRRVALTEFGPVYVSTVFLGLDHAFGGPVPILFETMIFGAPLEELDYYQERYATLEEACLGHERAVALVRRWLPVIWIARLARRFWK